MMTWEQILTESPRFLDKTAGLFMRPSDIAGHTELARELESRLNGVSSAAKFKHQPGGVEKTASRYIDAGVGTAAGLAADLLSRRRARALLAAHKADDITALNQPENLERLNAELERIARDEHGVSLADLKDEDFYHALSSAKKKISQSQPRGGNRIRQAIARANRAAAEARVHHPIAAGLVSAGTGALAGYRSNLNMKRHYDKFMRNPP